MSIPPIGSNSSPFQDPSMQQAFQHIVSFQNYFETVAAQMRNGEGLKPGEAVMFLDKLRDLQSFIDSHKQLLAQMEHLAGNKSLNTAITGITALCDTGEKQYKLLLSDLESGKAGFPDQALSLIDILKSAVSRPI